MILTGLLMGAALLVGVSLLTAFWNDITDWLKRAAQKVKDVVGVFAIGFTVFVKKMREGLKEISKHYTKKGTQWEETVVTKEISEDQVPPEIRAKANSMYETDITKDYELALTNG